MSTNYTSRTVPTTSYNTRPIIQTYDWITWFQTTDTWASVTETWDDYYFWVIEWTQYTVRNII